MLFEQFESDVMQKILCEIPEIAEVLFKQYASAIVLNREFTGYGFLQDTKLMMSVLVWNKRKILNLVVWRQILMMFKKELDLCCI